MSISSSSAIASPNVAFYIKGESVANRLSKIDIQEMYLELLGRTHIRITGPREILTEGIFNKLFQELIAHQMKYIKNPIPKIEDDKENNAPNEHMQRSYYYTFKETGSSKEWKIFCELSLDRGFKKAFEYEKAADVPIHLL